MMLGLAHLLMVYAVTRAGSATIPEASIQVSILGSISQVLQISIHIDKESILTPLSAPHLAISLSFASPFLYNDFIKLIFLKCLFYLNQTLFSQLLPLQSQPHYAKP
jgi:hypothetical protein